MSEKSMPQTAKEAEQMGLKRVPADEVTAPPGGNGEKKEKVVGGLCYNGPCISGQMQVCYFSDGDLPGCTQCYWWPC